MVADRIINISDGLELKLYSDYQICVAKDINPMPPKKRPKLKVKRKANKIVGDSSRVITRLHLPDERCRILKIIQRIMSLPKNYLPGSWWTFPAGTKTSGTFLSAT
jgi:hypothetical protein